jgi:hypothetical protein
MDNQFGVGTSSLPPDINLPQQPLASCKKSHYKYLFTPAKNEFSL